MKLTSGDSKISMTDTEVSTASTSKSSCGRPLIAAFALTTVVIICGILAAVLVVVIKNNATQRKEKEAWVTVKIDESFKSERVRASDHEEEYYLPGVYQAVFDFQTSLLIIQDFKWHPEICMVTPFDKTNFTTPEELMQLITGGNLEQTRTDTFQLPVEQTNAKLDQSLLSEKAATMCRGKELVWVVPACTTYAIRAKREASGKMKIKIKRDKIKIKIKGPDGSKTKIKIKFK